MSKTPLVLLPGTLCNATLWRHQIRHLSDIADVTVGDLTQNGSIVGMARTVLASAPERFALAGLSMGGPVALEIMHQAPERVTRLALLDTNDRTLPEDARAHWQNYIALVGEGRFDEIAETFLKNTLHPERREEPALVSTVVQMAKDVGKDAFLRQAQAVLNRADKRSILPQISCPTLILVGRQDTGCPVELHEEIAAAIPDAALVIIEQCGHLSSLEQPQAVTAVLRYWFQIA